MPVTTLPCPKCGRPHSVVHDPHHDVGALPCAACEFPGRRARRPSGCRVYPVARKREILRRLNDPAVPAVEVGYDVQPESGE